MTRQVSIIILSCISVLFCNIHILYAQKITPSDSTTIQQKVTKYGKVQLRTSIMQVSLDAVKANLICGKDTLKEDYKSLGFFFWNKVPAGIARAIVWAAGFIAESDTLYVREGQTTQKDFYLTDRVIQLRSVTVKGKIPAMVYRDDTIRFNPQGINILEDDVARNILEQMPGVQVSEQGVKVAGKDVEKTYVDGKKIFGENPMNALNHLPANDVVYISAYDEDEHKEQTRKNRKGKKRRVLNIETKSKLVNSKEGNLIASIGGNMEKQQLADHDIRYGIGGTFNFFSEKMLVAINAMHNNLNRATNQPQIFLSTRNPAQTYSENSFGGINLSRRWEKETGFYKEIKGSYQFTRIATEANTRTEQEYFATDAFWQKSYLSQYQNADQSNKHAMNTGFSMNDKKWGTLAIDYTLSANHSRQNTLQQITNSVDESQSTGILQQHDNGKSQEYEHSPYYYDNIRDITKISTTRIGVRFATNLISRLRTSTYWSIHYRQASTQVNDQSNRILTNRLTIDMTCTPMSKYFFAKVSYTYQHQNNKTYHQIDKDNYTCYIDRENFGRYCIPSIFPRNSERSNRTGWIFQEELPGNMKRNLLII